MKSLFLMGIVGIGLAAAVAQSSALAGSPRYPNIVARPASDVRLESSGGQTLLRFSTTSWNNGQGPLELVNALGVNPNKTQAYQNIYDADGNVVETRPAGQFTFEGHESHNHWHYDGYARYQLFEEQNANGAPLREGTKVTFCIMDTTRINLRLPDAPKHAVYNTCGAEKQGMSVGWGDTYGYWLSGQFLDVTDLLDGTYILRITVDPNGRLLELNETDNVSEVRLSLSGGSVQVLDDSPRGRRPR